MVLFMGLIIVILLNIRLWIVLWASKGLEFKYAAFVDN